jgi:hypothetical protein
MSGDEMTSSYSEICGGERGRFLSGLEGTVLGGEGELICFVAAHLEKELSSGGTPVPELPPTPPQQQEWGLLEIEADALRLAASVDSLAEQLSEILHGVSALTVDCLDTYRDAVCKTCDCLDLNIKSMYQLMAKCEELSNSMAPTYKLAQHIKNIKHLLDLIDAS